MNPERGSSSYLYISCLGSSCCEILRRDVWMVFSARARFDCPSSVQADQTMEVTVLRSASLPVYHPPPAPPPLVQNVSLVTSRPGLHFLRLKFNPDNQKVLILARGRRGMLTKRSNKFINAFHQNYNLTSSIDKVV